MEPVDITLIVNLELALLKKMMVSQQIEKLQQSHHKCPSALVFVYMTNYTNNLKSE